MLSEAQYLHFAEPWWFCALLVPLLLWWWPRRRGTRLEERLARYADPHLLPHLVLVNGSAHTLRRWLTLWSLLWALGVSAMAGPRLGYTEMQRYRPGTSVFVLLDLSRSMLATDVKPSRFERARQEVQDLLDRNPGFRIGLMAFASLPHLVVPITEDDETLRYLLPALSPELVNWPGSRVSSAIEQARRLFASEPEEATRAVVLVSDGDFADSRLEREVALLRAAGIRLHVLGIGTPEGARVPAAKGGWLRAPSGELVVSQLVEARLNALAVAGSGVYRRADFRDADSRDLLAAIAAHGGALVEEEGSHRIWHERYYVPVAGMLVLWLFGDARRRRR